MIKSIKLKGLKQLPFELLRFVRLFFHSRKPVFEQLETCTLVVEQKPLLLICWRNKFRYSVHVKAAKFSRYEKSGMHIVKLPLGINELNITLRSGWRKTVYPILLTSVPVPAEWLIEWIADTGMIKLPVVYDFRGAPRFSAELCMPAIVSLVGHSEINIPYVEIRRLQYDQP